ncbi:MAG: SH3 domain-containing protein [Clostridia bacterium]|nr:SH3 domain-containing protein [Clostridia bacterium]
MRSTKKAVFRSSALFLVLALLLSSFPITAFAEDSRSGVVTGNSVNVRTGPSTGYDSVGVKLNSGHSVTILGEAPDGKGGSVPWYQISFIKDGVSYTGYMRSDYVRIIPTVIPDPPAVENPDFETQLASFPEDYKPSIIALHQQHPTWNFRAYHTGLDWSAVQSLENRLGWSYINDGVLSHYSTAPGAYDWETDTYVVKEGNNWYQAHPDMVAYFMDPRNFLNETDLFQFELLAFSPESQTEAAIAEMLKGTFMEGKTLWNTAGIEISYARAFLDAANLANVSAFHLIARCIQEVGWGGSSCSHGTYPGYEGYYNFFNIGAYTGAADGMAYAKNNGWDSPYKAILAGGNFIGSSYIARGQNTPYFQKYDVVNPNSVAAHQYMTNVAAARSEGRIQRKKYVDMGILETGFTFTVPVYLNMPATPCLAPAAAGSPNNYLKDLQVEGYSLTPTFDFYDSLYNGQTSYNLKIDEYVSSINVRAVAAGKAAILGGDLGTVPVEGGSNTVSVTCTAENGSVRTYTIHVEVRRQGPLPGSMTGADGYDMDDAIYVLFHCSFPDEYPVTEPVDFDGSGEVDMDDAIYLLFYCSFPDEYPLH